MEPTNGNGSVAGDATPFEGAGGKLRRQRPRRTSYAPYARPPENEAHRTRWISRIMDPARRLITGGLNRILPNFLPPVSSVSASLLPSGERQDDLNSDLKQPSCSDPQVQIIDLPESGLADEPSPSGVAEKSNVFSLDEQEEKVVNSDDGLSEIEKLLNGKQFSRDEADRLVEILSSKAASSSVEVQRDNVEVATEGLETDSFVLQDSKKPHESRKDKNYFPPLAVQTPPSMSIMSDELGKSPIEIAKAYMRNQASDVCLRPRGFSSKYDDERAGRLFFPSPSPKPSTCWPGAVIQDQYNSRTPESQRVRYGLQNFPRTPYARSIFSKSKSKLGMLHGDNTRHQGNPFGSSLQTPTSYGQLNTIRGKKIGGEPGLVGPIRKSRNKLVTQTPVRNTYSSTSTSAAQVSELPEGTFPAIGKNLGGSIGKPRFDGMLPESEGTSKVNPHSSQVAQTILEHLERTQPTPKDKYAEVKLATSWRKELDQGIGYQQNTEVASRSIMGQLNLNRPKASAGEAGTVERERTLGAVRVGNINSNDSNKSGSFKFPKEQEYQSLKISHEATKKPVPIDSSTELPRMPKASNNSLGSRAILPAITVENPMAKWVPNSAGFSFPVPTSSGTFSEPPTPSVLPTTNVPGHPEEETSDVTSYSFGMKKASQPLVFSFPCISGAESGEVPDIRFEFGSDKSERISFAIPSVAN